MTKPAGVFACLLLAITPALAQTPQEILEKVRQSQKMVKTISYSLERKDTLVTGTIRQFEGEVKMHSMPEDRFFGFRFWAKRNDIAQESIFDGGTTFDINHAKKTYRANSNPESIPHFLGSPGGQVVFCELLRLDTAGVYRYELRQDSRYYYVKMLLNDIKEYNVVDRSHTLYIDKKWMLPVEAVYRQMTDDVVQDLHYRITRLSVNQPADAYDFSLTRFPEDYSAEKNEGNKKQEALLNRPAPALQASFLDGKPFTPSQLNGKLVLLDFWEVWCGPCIASMPKVQALYEKYKAKGLEVYGIMSEQQQLTAAQKLLSRQKISFPNLLGNEALKKAYFLNAVPLYVLIDKQGKILLIHPGYPDKLESIIQQHL